MVAVGGIGEIKVLDDDVVIEHGSSSLLSVLKVPPVVE
jgi:hypothetical protein